MKKLGFCIAILLKSVVSNAQVTEYDVRKMVNDAPESQLVVESSRMLQENYYYFSEIITDKLLQINPNSSNYNYRKGFIVLDSRSDWSTALPYLLVGAKDVSKNYDMYSPKENSAPTDVYFHIARCYHLDHQIDKAREYYNLFLKETSGKSELIDKVKLRLLQCDVAAKSLANPNKVTVSNLGPVINTRYPDYSPVISLDGSSLYFTSRRQWEDQSTDEYRDPMLNQFPEDIYVAQHNIDNSWTAPKRLEFCNDKLNEATVFVSSDERRIYTYEDRTGNGDLYSSDFINNNFQAITKLNQKGINTKYWETHCTVTPDGLQMYFVSDRLGGYGGRDIYRTVKLPNGTWSEPLNLGPTVNTQWDEDSPFIAVDNKTLYFASNGNQSMGGFDIFMTFRADENKWTTPINLGFPLNSAGDDIFYTTTSDGLTGYLTSFRKDGQGEKDIYEIKNDYLGTQGVVVLKGRVLTSDGSALPENVFVQVKCLTCGDKSVYNINPRLRDGAFMSGLTPCQEYEISFKNDTLSTNLYTEKFSTNCSKGYEEVYKQLILDPVRKRVYPKINYHLDGTIAQKIDNKIIEGAVVSIYDAKSGALLQTLSSNNVGMYFSDLLKSKVYGEEIHYNFKVSKESYLTQNFEYKVLLDKDTMLHASFLLEKNELGLDLAKTLNLKPIYFDLDKSNIRPDAKIELDKIVKVMNENPTLVVELGSHTDCRSSYAYNRSLSDRRAKSSAAYIKARITNPSRIYGKGYGEAQLINDCGCEGTVVSNCSEEDHQLNRRTEFRIVKN